MQVPVLTDKASQRWGRSCEVCSGCGKEFDSDRKETDAASVDYAHESTHAAFDGQTLSRNRPGWESGYVCLRDETETNMGGI